MVEVKKILSFQAVINMIFLAQSKKVSWFPPPNIWDACGFSVGQWTHECESWFQEHIAKIRSGTFQPLSSKDWRAMIRNTRLAPKLMYQMRLGAASYISAHRHDILTVTYPTLSQST